MSNTVRYGALPITPAQVRIVTQRLREQLSALHAQLAVARAQGAAEVMAQGEVIDTKDRAEREQRSQADAATEARLTDEVAAATAALERLADGTYGVCIDCRGAIGLGRLLVQPAAARCLRCQTKHEQPGVPGTG
jgi:RNA polymerase-binding transcription factor DksA